MKVRTPDNGLSLPATIETADLAKGTLVTITDDRTVDAADADETIVGHVFKAAREADGSGTIETKARHLVEGVADGAIAAGDEVKMGTSAAGVQKFKKWVSQTDTVAGDTPETRIGICWFGGGNGDTVEVLLY